MAKKAKKARKGKKPNYKQGWETRRRNAILRADRPGAGPKEIANLGKQYTDAVRPTGRAIAEAQQADRSTLRSKATALIVAARKKDGPRAIEGLLAQLALDHAYQGRSDAERRFSEERKALFETQSVNIIAGFIAEMETIERLNRGLPHTIITSGRTMARVVDALQKAGYNRNGFTQPDRRDEIMNRTHAEQGR